MDMIIRHGEVGGNTKYMQIVTFPDEQNVRVFYNPKTKEVSAEIGLTNQEIENLSISLEQAKQPFDLLSH